jgi:4a-hydroxytetrahydrobiopterin dehydratase
MAKLGEEEIQARLERLGGGWRRAEGEPAAIEREFALGDFAEALAFVNRVGAAAEAADHHPDILLHGWNRVRLTLSTHSQGGLTAADFELAAQIGEPA